ncbi:hypothetical protein ACJX0J_015177, partial [Zea mays]
NLTPADSSKSTNEGQALETQRRGSACAASILPERGAKAKQRSSASIWRAVPACSSPRRCSSPSLPRRCRRRASASSARRTRWWTAPTGSRSGGTRTPCGSPRRPSRTSPSSPPRAPASY